MEKLRSIVNYNLLSPIFGDEQVTIERNKRIEFVGLAAIFGGLALLGATAVLGLTLKNSVNANVQLAVGVTGVMALLVGRVLHRIGHGGAPFKLRVGALVLGIGILAVGILGLNTWIHEGGHALMAKAVFNTDVTVTVNPFFGGGVTKYSTTDLTNFGAWLGKDRGLALIALSGAGATTLVAMGEVLIAKVVNKKCRVVSSALRWHAAILMIGMLSYAFGALFERYRTPGHDFFKIKDLTQLDPLVVSGVLVGAFLALRTSLHYVTSNSNQPERSWDVDSEDAVNRALKDD